MSASSKDSHILSMLSSFFTFVIQTPPRGDSYQKLVRQSFTYFPHGHFLIPEEEQIYFSRHGRRALHVHVEVEEVLDRRDLAQWFQLVLVALLGLYLLGWRCALLLKHVGGGLALVEPELPVGL